MDKPLSAEVGLKREHMVGGFHRNDMQSRDKPLDLDVKQDGACEKSERELIVSEVDATCYEEDENYSDNGENSRYEMNYAHKAHQSASRSGVKSTTPASAMTTHQIKNGITVHHHNHPPPHHHLAEYTGPALCCNPNYGVPFLSTQQCSGSGSSNSNVVNGNAVVSYPGASMDLSALYSNGLFPAQNGIVAPPPPSPSYLNGELTNRSHSGGESRNDERHTCRLCQKTFNNKHNLNKHINLHTGSETFTCTICHKKFSEKGNLTKHMNIHTGSKTYTCNVCGKTFYWLSSLSKHRAIHTGAGEKFACTVCEKLFSEKGNLTKHMNIHTGSKTFACDICEKVFYWKGSLTMHQMIHTGDKLYTCGHCNRKFRWRTSYNKHVHAHVDVDTCSEKSSDPLFVD